jgi:cytochrome P450
MSSNVGKLARIGPNTLITCDVDQVNRMNAARSPYVRSDWYLGFRLAPGIDNVFSMLDEKAHTKRRAQMNLGVSPRTFTPTLELTESS